MAIRWTRERGASVPVMEDLMESSFLRNWEVFDLSSERGHQRLSWARMMREAMHEGPIAGVPGNAYTVNAPAFALSTSAKTAINIISGTANQPSIVEFGVSCNATTGDALIELCYSTQGAAGTVGSSPTPTQMRGWPAQTSAATAGISYSAEPTTLVRQKAWRMAMPGGPLVIQAPLGREPTGIVTAATSGKGICLRLTASTGTPTSDSYVEYEE